MGPHPKRGMKHLRVRAGGWTKFIRSTHKRQLIIDITKRDGTKCWICMGELVFNGDPNGYWYRSLDHVISPKEGGAPFDIKNIRLAHRYCNSARQNGHKDERK